MKVTNHHDGLLNVAGVDIRPGADHAVTIDDKKFEQWSKSNSAKQWIEAGVISTDGKVDVKAAKEGQTDRQALEARALELGVAFDSSTEDDDLADAIAQQEAASKENERDNLLKEARDLGLNPNANTGTEKLKKMIADKKAQTA